MTVHLLPAIVSLLLNHSMYSMVRFVAPHGAPLGAGPERGPKWEAH